MFEASAYFVGFRIPVLPNPLQVTQWPIGGTLASAAGCKDS